MSEWKRYLRYDSETGIFYWIVRPVKQSPIRIGSIAGCVKDDGYRMIKLKNETVPAHRLAWFFVYGVLPDKQIDHINGDRDDNRIANLRLASCRENAMNRKSHREGRLVGANYHPQRKGKKVWQSVIGLNGRKHSLGYYETELEAHNAYMDYYKAMQVPA